MKKAVRFLIIVGLVLLLPASRAYAQDGGFSEDFEDQALSGWERSEGAVVQDGILVISPENFAFKIGDYQEYTLSFDVKFSGEGLLFLRFNTQEGNDNAFLFFEDSIVLEQVVNDQPAVLAESTWDGFSTEWTKVQMMNSASGISLSIDGTDVIQSEPGDAYSAGGGLGFFIEGQGSAQLDNMVMVDAVENEQPAAAGTIEQPVKTQPAAAPPNSFESIVSTLAASQSATLNITDFALNLLLSVALSYILSRVYIHWGSSLSNRRRFAANFILITVTTTFIILVVRSSVALSLGLVGALSIVRFRAAIKEPEELAYLFFAIGIGIGLGDNQRLITGIAMAVVILVMVVMRLFRGRKADFNLHLTVFSGNPGQVELEEINAVVGKHTSQYRLMRLDQDGDTVEASYLVEFANQAKFIAVKNDLRGLSKNIRITFLDNKGLG